MSESKPPATPPHTITCSTRLIIAMLLLWGISAPIGAYYFGHMQGIKAGILQRYDSITGKIDSSYQDIKDTARRTTGKAKEKLSGAKEKISDTKGKLMQRWNDRKSTETDSETTPSRSSWFGRDTVTTASEETTTPSRLKRWFSRDKKTTESN